MSACPPSKLGSFLHGHHIGSTLGSIPCKQDSFSPLLNAIGGDSVMYWRKIDANSSELVVRIMIENTISKQDLSCLPILSLG